VESWHALHGVFERIRGQAAGSWEQGKIGKHGAGSKEQGAQSRESKAGRDEQRAESERK